MSVDTKGSETILAVRLSAAARRHLRKMLVLLVALAALGATAAERERIATHAELEAARAEHVRLLMRQRQLVEVADGLRAPVDERPALAPILLSFAETRTPRPELQARIVTAPGRRKSR